jgi:hypothetical protein
MEKACANRTKKTFELKKTERETKKNYLCPTIKGNPKPLFVKLH